MSANRMSLMVGFGLSTLAAQALGQQGQSFEGCGVLRETAVGEPCVAFFPDNGQFSMGLGRLGGWSTFGIEDHVYLSGTLVECGGFCTFEGLCFNNGTPISSCPSVPAVSGAGLALLVVVVSGIGAFLLRKRTPISSARVFSAIALLTVATHVHAQGMSVTARVADMLESDHHPTRVIVRFKEGADQVAREAAHRAAGTVPLKSYRLVPGLMLVELSAGRLAAALTNYLNDDNVLYAEPDYVGYVSAIPSDLSFSTLWGMQNTGQTVNGDPGTAGGTQSCCALSDGIYVGDYSICALPWQCLQFGPQP